MAGRLLSWKIGASVVDTGVREDFAPTTGTGEGSDPQLLELEAVYRIRRPEVIRFLVRYGVDVVEAEDITQEVFLNALRSTQKDRTGEYFFRWILVCAKNVAINRYRRGKREILAPADLWTYWRESLPDPAPGLTSALQARERFERFRVALSSLNEVEQQCVLLRSRGNTFQEIATALRVPLRSAIYTTGSALQKLQRRLKNA